MDQPHALQPRIVFASGLRAAGLVAVQLVAEEPRERLGTRRDLLPDVGDVGGTAGQACDAAAIGFQNTMGSVCDLLHGSVEIPCHTRNGAAAASALVNADLVLGGYTNLIPLDETIDAVYAVGRAMPAELRCTSKGGLAVTPSARALQPGWFLFPSCSLL